jgi:Protein of unknown function (DUF2934)
MAAPSKSKAAGVRTGKTKGKTANGGPAAANAAVSPAHQNGVSMPNPDVIRARAYEVFVARGGNRGDELSDWLTAERELMGKAASHG